MFKYTQSVSFYLWLQTEHKTKHEDGIASCNLITRCLHKGRRIEVCCTHHMTTAWGNPFICFWFDLTIVSDFETYQWQLVVIKRNNLYLYANNWSSACMMLCCPYICFYFQLGPTNESFASRDNISSVLHLIPNYFSWCVITSQSCGYSRVIKLV